MELYLTTTEGYGIASQHYRKKQQRISRLEVEMSWSEESYEIYRLSMGRSFEDYVENHGRSAGSIATYEKMRARMEAARQRLRAQIAEYKKLKAGWW